MDKETKLDHLIEAVRIVGKGKWDAPGWNLHVSAAAAHLLFDIAYDYPAPARGLPTEEMKALREKHLRRLRGEQD